MVGTRDHFSLTHLRNKPKMYGENLNELALTFLVPLRIHFGVFHIRKKKELI